MIYKVYIAAISVILQYFHFIEPQILINFFLKEERK